MLAADPEIVELAKKVLCDETFEEAERHLKETECANPKFYAPSAEELVDHLRASTGTLGHRPRDANSSRMIWGMAVVVFDIYCWWKRDQYHQCNALLADAVGFTTELMRDAI
jgi:hypothetical protein